MNDNTAKLLVRVAVDALLKDIEPSANSIEEYQRMVTHLSLKCPRLLQATVHLEGENVISLGLIKWLSGIPTQNSEIFFLSVRKAMETSLMEAAEKSDERFFNF